MASGCATWFDMVWSDVRVVRVKIVPDVVSGPLRVFFLSCDVLCFCAACFSAGYSLML